MSLALYRKYRPKTLEDLLGQESTVQILQNSARQNHFAHAYLFYGSRGTGKTSTARLIAKLLNCEKRHADPKFQAEGEPCNKCGSCLEIDSNTSLDVVEIDAASNRGIDEIRNLKENLRVAPTGGHHKVYIVDEVHMLTGPAFNALLKTLEEPPAHVVFVLATTEYEKLPATITSRTQRFIFKRLPKSIILSKLENIAQIEKIKIDPDALDLLAAAGEGSFRDAESLLDQIASSGEKITLSAVEKLTGRIGFKKVEQLTDLIIKTDTAGVLKALSEIQEEGYNVVQLARDLIHYLRRVVSLKFNPSLKEHFQSELTKDELESLKKFSDTADADKMIILIKSLIRAYTEMRYSPFAIVPLEIALIEHLKK